MAGVLTFWRQIAAKMLDCSGLIFIQVANAMNIIFCRHLSFFTSRVYINNETLKTIMKHHHMCYPMNIFRQLQERGYKFCFA